MISHDRAQELISARMDAPLTAGGAPRAAATPGDVRCLSRFRRPGRRAGARSAGAAAAGAEPGRLPRRHGGDLGTEHVRLGLAAAKPADALVSRHGRRLRVWPWWWHWRAPSSSRSTRPEWRRMARRLEPESTIAAVAIAPLPTEVPTEIPTPSQNRPRPARRCGRSPSADESAGQDTDAAADGDASAMVAIAEPTPT